MQYTHLDVLEVMKKKNYVTFDNVVSPTETKNYNLNIVGVRYTDYKTKITNSFTDDIWLIWQDLKNDWVGIKFQCTTIAGDDYFLAPMTEKGTAILAEGQHRGMWEIGFHRGKYEALIQRKEALMYRDNDKDLIAEIDSKANLESVGINCHRALEKGNTKAVDNFSGGCQVLANGADWEIFLSIIKKSAENWGKVFSYTLINIQDIKEIKSKNLLSI